MENSQTLPHRQSEPSSSSQKKQNTAIFQDFSIEDIEKILGDMQLQQNNHYSLNVKSDQYNKQFITQVQTDTYKKNSKRQKISLNDITVNRSEVIFGENQLFPGSIQEIDFCVAINSNQGHEQVNDKEQGKQNLEIDEQPQVLRIIVKCLNQEFQNLDEYVFSVRSNNCYDYYEEVRYKIKRAQRADVKVAVKIPQLKQKCLISGFLHIILGDLEPIQIPIQAKFTIPQIICLKEIYKQDQQTRMIRVPAKKSQQRTPPIPFKNLNPYNITIEVEAVSNQNFTNKPYDIITQNLIFCQENSQFFLNMQVKQNLNFIGQYPSRMIIRKILLMKIKNSSVFFHYPLEVTIFEGLGSDNS